MIKRNSDGTISLQFDPPKPVVQFISITPGSSTDDPCDFAPIMVHFVGGLRPRVAAVGWRIRLAIWFLRRYVSGIK